MSQAAKGQSEATVRPVGAVLVFGPSPRLRSFLASPFAISVHCVGMENLGLAPRATELGGSTIASSTQAADGFRASANLSAGTRTINAVARHASGSILFTRSITITVR